MRVNRCRQLRHGPFLVPSGIPRPGIEKWTFLASGVYQEFGFEGPCSQFLCNATECRERQVQRVSCRAHVVCLPPTIAPETTAPLRATLRERPRNRCSASHRRDTPLGIEGRTYGRGVYY